MKNINLVPFTDEENYEGTEVFLRVKSYGNMAQDNNYFMLTRWMDGDGNIMIKNGFWLKDDMFIIEKTRHNQDPNRKFKEGDLVIFRAENRGTLNLTKGERYKVLHDEDEQGYVTIENNIGDSTVLYHLRLELLKSVEEIEKEDRSNKLFYVRRDASFYNVVSNIPWISPIVCSFNAKTYGDDVAKNLAEKACEAITKKHEKNAPARP